MPGWTIMGNRNWSRLKIRIVLYARAGYRLDGNCRAVWSRIRRAGARSGWSLPAVTKRRHGREPQQCPRGKCADGDELLGYEISPRVVKVAHDKSASVG